MGISIVLYRVGQAEKFEDLVKLEQQLESEDANSIDLYKMYHDLALIFTNNVNPYGNIDSPGYKVLFGNPIRMNVGANEVGGFISTSEVKELDNWIKSNSLNTQQGFIQMLRGLSPEVLYELVEIGDNDFMTLYSYVEILAGLYDAAKKENNALIICAE